MTKMNGHKFVFFGTGEIAQHVLSELVGAQLYPALIVTAPDKPQGRGLTVAPSPVGILAENLAIPQIKPARIDESAIETLKSSGCDLFVVADYGALLRKVVLDIPAKGTLNMHPSLLPRLRGPSPIRSAILADESQTGVSIMVLDEQMDHGPVLAQKKVVIEPWPPRASFLEERLAREGGKLLAEMIPLWLSGEIDARAQNHDIATYTKKFEKEDGRLNFMEDARTNLLKIRAYEGWPTAFAFFERNGKTIRVQILDAHIEGDILVLDVVKPEGKQAMTYAEFVRSGATPIME